MEEQALKQQLFGLLDQAQAAQHALFDVLMHAERDAVGTAERWSIKDTVVHMSFWKRAMANRLAAAAQGETPPDLTDYERFNALTFQQNRLRPWAEVIAEAEQINASVHAHIQPLSLADLTERDRFAWQNGRPLLASVVSNGYEHPLIHTAQLYIDRGDRERAMTLIETAFAALMHEDAQLIPRGEVVYNLACFYATIGQPEHALRLLTEALRLAPELRAWSREDADLVSLHELPAYQALYEE